MASIERGTFLLFISNFVFFLSSFLIYFFLGKFLLTPAQLGVFSIVIAIVSMLASTFVNALQQAITKFIAEKPETDYFIRKKLFFYQFFIGLIMAAAYFLCSDLIAFLLNDPSLAPFLRISSALLLFQPIVGIYNGLLNGRHEFSKLAVYSIFYYIFKLIAILLFVAIGFQVFGAVAGFVLSSAVAMFVGFFITKVPEKKQAPDLKKMLSFCIPIAFFTFAVYLFQSLDLFAIKAFSLADSDALAGNYAIASTIAKLPPALLVAVSTVALPLISAALNKKNAAKTKFYVCESLRYSFLFLALSTAAIAASANSIVVLIFSEKYLFAAHPLAILAFAYLFFGFFQLLATIILAAGKLKALLFIVFAGLAVSFALNFFLVPVLSLVGAAIASLAAMLICFLISSFLVFSEFKVFMPLKSIFRISFAAVLVFLFLAFFNASGLLLILFYFFAAVIYMAALFLIGELKKRDANIFLRALH